jgi:hypothetical protein
MPRLPWAHRAKIPSRQPSGRRSSKAFTEAVLIACPKESVSSGNTEIAETKLCDKEKTTVVKSKPIIVEIAYEHSTEIESNPLQELEAAQEMRCDEEEPIQELEAAREMRCDEESVTRHERGEEPQDSIEITNEQYLEFKQIFQDPMYQVNDIIEPSSTTEVNEERTPADVQEWTEVLVYSDLGSVTEKNAADVDFTADQTMPAKWGPEAEVVPPPSDKHGITIKPGPVDVDEVSLDDVTEADEYDNSESSSVKVATADNVHPLQNTLTELRAVAEDIRFVFGFMKSDE